MGDSRSNKLNDQAVTLASAVATLPVPAAPGDGGDLTVWRSNDGSNSFDVCTISIDSDGASTLTAPVQVFGFDDADSQWRLCGILNGGNDVTLTAVIGFEQRLIDVGVFERLLVSAAGVSAGNITVKATPIETTGG